MLRCRHDAFFTYNTVSFDTSSGHVAAFCDKTGVLRLMAKFIKYSLPLHASGVRTYW